MLSAVSDKELPVERQTYTIAEAARILGVSKETLYKAAARGDLPHIRFGKRVLIPRAFIERLLCGEQTFESNGDPDEVGES